MKYPLEGGSERGNGEGAALKAVFRCISLSDTVAESSRKEPGRCAIPMRR